MNATTRAAAEAAAEQQATDNMAVFVADLRARGLKVKAFTRTGFDDYFDALFGYEIAFADGRSLAIEMPGEPLERVRWMREDGQDPRTFRRLRVGARRRTVWMWRDALAACAPGVPGVF